MLRANNGASLSFPFVISRISIVVANSLVAPAIVGAGAVGWYGATNEVGQEVPTSGRTASCASISGDVAVTETVRRKFSLSAKTAVE
jgi:hypothetical protein